MRPITTLIALLVGLLCLPAAAQAQQTFKAGAITYVLDENPVQAGFGYAFARMCPDNLGISAGGFAVSGPPGAGRFGGSHPVDFKTSDEIRFDGWRTMLFNPGPDERTMTSAMI